MERKDASSDFRQPVTKNKAKRWDIFTDYRALEHNAPATAAEWHSESTQKEAATDFNEFAQNGEKTEKKEPLKNQRALCPCQ